MPLELAELNRIISERRARLNSDAEIRAGLLGLVDEAMLDAALSDRFIKWWPNGGIQEGGAAVYTTQGRPQWYSGGEYGPRWNSLKQVWSEGRLRNENAAISAIDTSSTDIVSLLSDPRGDELNNGVFSDRGLVIGYVQSGKTTSFTAVAAKAADAGYKVVVVLSGLVDNLRRQTQARLDSDLTPSGKWIPLTSVGEIEETSDGKKRLRVGDFPKLSTVQLQQFGPASDLTGYAVVKKNVSRLKNLYKWLEKSKSLWGDIPILIIDDEADQGSIDTAKAKDEEKRTAINKAILQILKLPRVSYLGYTATPFANLLIDPRFQRHDDTWDLFPRDFIYALPEPGAAYFGTKAIFGFTPPDISDEDPEIIGAPVVKPIAEDEAKKLGKKLKERSIREEVIEVENSSLGEAVRYFFLATAARIHRGQGHRHSTMLAHTSQFVLNHGSLSTLLTNYLGNLRERMQFEPNELLAKLESEWNEEAGKFNPEGNVIEAFEEIEPILRDLILEGKVEVIIENGSSDDRLDYKGETVGTPGQYQIVVGGNVLARGLTLEGLVSTYFCRTSKTYDALLQMGRWFGYRVGYADLPRIWMTESTREGFNHLAQVEEELRLNIRKLQSDPNMNPLEAALKIRSHPKLAITAPNRMQYAEKIESDFSQSTHQTTHFEIKDKNEISDNWDAGARLVQSICNGQFERSSQPGKQVFFDVDETLITRFLSDYHFRETWAASSSDLLRFISVESSPPHSLKWNVAVISGIEVRDEVELGTLAVRPLGRSRLKRMGQNAQGKETIADINALKNSSTDESVDLVALGVLEKESIKEWKLVRNLRREALLALYPLAKDGKVSNPNSVSRRSPRVDMDAAGNLLGFMLVFPSAEGRHEGSFVRLNSAFVDAALEHGELESEILDVESEND